MQDPSLQGFLTGGQQKAWEDANKGVDFGPTDSLQQTRLGVFRSLGANAAPAQAEALARALGVISQQVQSVGASALERKGQADAAQGAADELLGKVDPVKQSTVEGYRIGAHRASVEQSAMAAIEGARQKMMTDWHSLPAFDTFDPQGNKVPGLMTNLDQYLSEQLSGLDKDPDAARVLAPMLQHFYNESAGQRVTRDAEITQQNAIETATELAQHSAITHDGSFKTPEQLEKLTGLFAGNKRAAGNALVSIVANAAINNGDPGLIDEYLPQDVDFGGGATLTPQNVAALDEARSRATEVQKKNQALAFGQDKAYFLKGIDEKLAAKQPLNFVDDLIRPYQRGLLTQPEVNELWNKSLELKDRERPGDFAMATLLAQRPWYTYVGREIGTTKDGSPIRVQKEDFENAATDLVSRIPAEQQPAAAVELTRRQGLIFKPLAATMSNMPLNTQQGVKAVLDTYTAMRNIDQTVASQYFNDPARLEQVESMNDLRKAGMSDTDIAQYIQRHDFKQAKENYTRFIMPQVQKKLDNFKVDDSHWFAQQVGSVHVNDLANAGEVLAQVTRYANIIGQQGLTSDPDTIIQRAERQVLEQNYLVRQHDGRSILVPRTKQDPPNTQAALQDFYKTQLPLLIQKSGYKGDPADVALVPSAYKDGPMVLMDHTFHQISHDTFTMQEISFDYAKRNRQDLIQQTLKDQTKEQELNRRNHVADDAATQQLLLQMQTQQLAGP